MKKIFKKLAITLIISLNLFGIFSTAVFAAGECLSKADLQKIVTITEEPLTLKVDKSSDGTYETRICYRVYPKDGADEQGKVDQQTGSLPVLPILLN